MTQKTRAELEAVFKQYNVPDDADYADFIESVVNIDDDGIVKVAEEPIRVFAVGNGEHALDLYDSNEHFDWRFGLKSPDGSKEGLNLATSSIPTTLFIDKENGNVGLNTANPQAKLHVTGDMKLGNTATVSSFVSDLSVGVAGSDAMAIPSVKAMMDYIDDLFVGSVAPYADDSVPDGWLVCDGRAINRTIYKRLFDRIGATFGQGDGSTTFNLPDLRNKFIRGWGHGAGTEASRVFGSSQSHAAKTHTHGMPDHDHSVSGSPGDISESGSHTHTFSAAGWDRTVSGCGAGNGSWLNMWSKVTNTLSSESHRHKIKVNSSSVGQAGSGSSSENTGGASETRPVNVTLAFCIKY